MYTYTLHLSILHAYKHLARYTIQHYAYLTMHTACIHTSTQQLITDISCNILTINIIYRYAFHTMHSVADEKVQM